MMALHVDATVLHGQHHFGAQVLIMVGGRHRKIAFPVARTVAEIVRFPARVPAALFGVDEVKAVILALVEADIIKNEKLGLGAELRSVGDAGGRQVDFGLARDVAGIAIVALLGHGIDHVADQHQRGDLGERIEQMKVGVGLEQHVALVDAGPRPNGRAVNAEAFFERGFRQLTDGIRNVVPEAGNVGESQVENPDVVLLCELENSLGVGHENSLPGANSSKIGRTVAESPANSHSNVAKSATLEWGTRLLQSVALCRTKESKASPRMLAIRLFL